MKPRPIPTELLEKYLKGTCTIEEKRVVEDWYFDLDGDEAESASPVPAFEKMKLFEKIKQHVEDFEGEERPRQAKVVLLSGRIKAAAAVAALFLLICGVYYFTQSTVSTGPAPVAYKADYITLQNSTSAIVERKLPDGSSVWLKPGSKLTYERKNEEADRDVTFTGEAFFEVAKDAKHPFIIRADEMNIRVLGTSFNVIALPKSRTFKVSVVTGKVQVTAKGKSGQSESVYLTPKQQASFNLNSQKIIQTQLSETQLKKQYWKPFTLNFSEDATMAMVSKELERAFQVKIEFSDPDLANCYLKVDFNNQQLPEIIDYLEKLLDVSCEMLDSGTLKITGQGCPYKS
jgi:ferric-dicitrate binding protein FerR (iron transport regulator)